MARRIPISAHVDPDLDERLADLAHRRRCSKSSIVETALVDYLNAHDKAQA